MQPHKLISLFASIPPPQLRMQMPLHFVSDHSSVSFVAEFGSSLVDPCFAYIGYWKDKPQEVQVSLLRYVERLPPTAQPVDPDLQGQPSFDPTLATSQKYLCTVSIDHIRPLESSSNVVMVNLSSGIVPLIFPVSPTSAGKSS